MADGLPTWTDHDEPKRPAKRESPAHVRYAAQVIIDAHAMTKKAVATARICRHSNDATEAEEHEVVGFFADLNRLLDQSRRRS